MPIVMFLCASSKLDPMCFALVYILIYKVSNLCFKKSDFELGEGRNENSDSNPLL